MISRDGVWSPRPSLDPSGDPTRSHHESARAGAPSQAVPMAGSTSGRPFDYEPHSSQSHRFGTSELEAEERSSTHSTVRTYVDLGAADAGKADPHTASSYAGAYSSPRAAGVFLAPVMPAAQSPPTRVATSGPGGPPPTGLFSWAKRRGKDPDEESEMDPDGQSMWSRGMLTSRPSTQTSSTQTQSSPASGRSSGRHALPRSGEPPRPLPPIAGSDYDGASIVSRSSDVHRKPPGPRPSMSPPLTATVRDAPMDDYSWQAMLYSENELKRPYDATGKLARREKEAAGMDAADNSGLAEEYGYGQAGRGGGHLYMATLTADDEDEEFKNIGGSNARGFAPIPRKVSRC